MFAHAMIHSHDIQESSSKVRNIAQKGKKIFRKLKKKNEVQNF